MSILNVLPEAGPDWQAIFNQVGDGLAFASRGPVLNLGDGLFITVFDSRYPRWRYDAQCLVDPQRDRLEIYLFQKRLRFGHERFAKPLQKFFEALSSETMSRDSSGLPGATAYTSSNEYGYAECYCTIEWLSGVDQGRLFHQLEVVRSRFDDAIPLLKMASRGKEGIVAAYEHIPLALGASVRSEYN